MSTLQQAADSKWPLAVKSYVLRRPTLLAAAACLVSFTGFWVAQRAADVSMIDLLVYRAEGWTVRNGHDLYAMRVTYADLPTTYPPFAALLFIPLPLLTIGDMRGAATFVNLALLVVLVHLTLRLLGRPRHVPRPAVTLLLAAVAVWCEPVWTTLRYGQINLLLAVLVLWDLSRRTGHRLAGVGIGIAAGIKLTPALFAVFLALCGAVEGWRRLRRTGSVADAWNPRLRQAAVATATFLGTVAVSALVLPRDSRTFWGETLFQSSRVGRTEISDNQSLSGVAARLLHTADPGGLWGALALVVAVLGLGSAVAAMLAGQRRLPHAHAWAASACAVTALLISPISWSHHWVWCVPVVVLLGAEAQRRASRRWLAGTVVAGVLFCSYALWWVPRVPGSDNPPELRQNGGQMLLSGIYPAVGVAFLVLTAVVAARALRKPAPYESPTARTSRPAGMPHTARTPDLREPARSGDRQAAEFDPGRTGTPGTTGTRGARGTRVTRRGAEAGVRPWRRNRSV
ncbi:glycosyltransferase 87 family protein [Streptomyces iconiensis]|uniref:glycosyltransferase 87 family protein n=1 Tax=Streptomyces iconiensis TaxID=1384038 RepID=UPI00321AEF3B